MASLAVAFGGGGKTRPDTVDRIVDGPRERDNDR